MLTIDNKRYYTEDELKQFVNNAESRVRLQKEDEVLKLLKSITPDTNYMFHGKKNTTVKFKDGGSITVRRMKGEQDSIETAFAYILAYKLFNKGGFKKLLKYFKEVK